jgi:NADPH:quinone reductase-like Zn-dependent oxidoreductase
MQQAVITRHGTPDVFALRPSPDPSPGDGEVRIRVQAIGVNFADLLARLGFYPGAPTPPFVPGYEVSGVIDARGPGVTGLHEGQRVLALTPFGGYSDVVVVKGTQVFGLPDELSHTDAAAIPVNYLTALLALYKLANLAAGETVLVHGAGGGVGIAATQLARLRQARIIGTASARKHDALRTFGVDEAIDYTTADVFREVRRLTNGRGADVILDPIGGASFATSYRLLAPLGRLVMYGVSAIAPGERRSRWHALREVWRMPRFKPLSLINGNRAVFGLHLGRLWAERGQLAAAMELLLSEVSAGRIRPVVARTFPLAQAAEAHRYLHARQNIGKVILTP